MTDDEALDLRPGDLIVGHDVDRGTYFIRHIDSQLTEQMNETDALVVLYVKSERLHSFSLATQNTG